MQTMSSRQRPFAAARRAPVVAALAAPQDAPRRKPHIGMLQLDALVIAAAAVLASHWAPVLGGWPLLTVLACPLLHLILRRD